MAGRINLGLVLIRNYKPSLKILWKGQSLWADSLWEDRTGKKRFRVKQRDKINLYPIVNDCRIPSLEEGDQDGMYNL